MLDIRFIKKNLDSNIVMTNGTVHISFKSNDDKDNGFFELIQTSGSGFTGIGKNEFIITEEQADLLKNKHINFDVINQSATAQSRDIIT
jgi:hypothetical protein